jgi:hypothetical protein
VANKDLIGCRKERDAAIKKNEGWDNYSKTMQHMVNERDQTIVDLKAKVSLLEQDIDIKAPLVKAGADTRLRNLENTRELI